MTTLLARAFKSIRAGYATPGCGAKRIGEVVARRVAVRKRWSEAFAESEDVLEKLADEAIAAKRQGKTTPLNLDRL